MLHSVNLIEFIILSIDRQGGAAAKACSPQFMGIWFIIPDWSFKRRHQTQFIMDLNMLLSISNMTN